MLIQSCLQGLYLSDIQDHLITMTQNLNHYEKILSRSHSNYLAQISIEMTDANNQINDVLSKLTALGTVLIPMNLVTGLWGMNVHVPGEDVKEVRRLGPLHSAGNSQPGRDTHGSYQLLACWLRSPSLLDGQHTSLWSDVRIYAAYHLHPLSLLFLQAEQCRM